MEKDHGLSDSGGRRRFQGFAEERGNLPQSEELDGQSYLVERSPQHLWSYVLRHPGWGRCKTDRVGELFIFQAMRLDECMCAMTLEI